MRRERIFRLARINADPGEFQRVPGADTKSIASFAAGQARTLMRADAIPDRD